MSSVKLSEIENGRGYRSCGIVNLVAESVGKAVIYNYDTDEFFFFASVDKGLEYLRSIGIVSFPPEDEQKSPCVFLSDDILAEVDKL